MTSFSFSTHGRDPIRALRDLNERGIVFRLDPLAGRAVGAEIAVHGNPDLRIMSAQLAGVSHGVGDGHLDEIALATIEAGTSAVRQRGREVVLADGEAILLRTSDGPFTLAHPERVRFRGLRLPRGAIAALAPGLDDAVLRPIRRDSPALRLLARYLPAVVRDGTLAELGAIVARHAHELVASLAGAAAEHTQAGAMAARLRAIQGDIARRLDEPDLAAASLAERHGISPRYVHKLFETTGTTFSAYVLELRLVRAREMLRDARWNHRAISEIAYAVGFGDLSYFNRTFRRRFGATPSQIRRR